MAFPLKDENPTKIRPILTISLIIANAAAFVAPLLFGSFEGVVDSLGMKPALIFSGRELHTLLTSMFLHGGYLHIIGNMWYLWIFGDNIEDAFGRAGFLLVYFVSGLAASFAHIISDPNSMIPTIGASGAISGILGAYAVLYPRSKVYTLLAYFYIWRIVELPAAIFLGFWFLLQVMSASVLLVGGAPSGVAYWAHIGGFIAGMLLILPVRRRARR